MKQRNRRDRLQNAAITLLMLSAVALFVRIQFYNLNVKFDFRQLSGNHSTVSSATTSRLSSLSVPVRVVVSGSYGRYGTIQLTTSDWNFSNLFGPRLREALGSAQRVSACDPADLLEALSSPSLYYDFCSPLPLSILSGMLGTETTAEDVPVRSLLLADCGEDTVRLFLRNGDDCAVYQVSLTTERLMETVNGCELGNAFFAFERTETDPSFAAVAPESLFLDPVPSLTTLTVRTSLSDNGWLLGALGINPNTKSRYTESGGTEVIMEGDTTVRIDSSGDVSYQGGDLFLNSRSDESNLQQLLLSANQWLTNLLKDRIGAAGLYLCDVQTSGHTVQFSFGYQIEGIPIRFSDGGCAVSMTVENGIIREMTLRIRQYTANNTPSSLLPLRQTLAVAAQDAGKELSVEYVDSGGESVSAAWVLD